MYETCRKKVVKEENEELEHYYTSRYNLWDTILFILPCFWRMYVLCKLCSPFSSSQWPLEALCSLKPLSMVAMYVYLILFKNLSSCLSLILVCSCACPCCFKAIKWRIGHMYFVYHVYEWNEIVKICCIIKMAWQLQLLQCSLYYDWHLDAANSHCSCGWLWLHSHSSVRVRGLGKLYNFCVKEVQLSCRVLDSIRLYFRVWKGIEGRVLEGFVWMYIEFEKFTLEVWKKHISGS